MHCIEPTSRHNRAVGESGRIKGSVAARSLKVVDCLYGGIMRRNLIHAALVAGLFLGAGAAPVFANALDSQLQPVASPIQRETVPFDGRETPGTIVIRTGERRLYFVLPDHQALRYGVGVGRPGFTWAGSTHIGYKREWPDWTPPAQMLRRRPDLPRHMAGGVDNPLGARAIYLVGTLYRIHGSNEPDTIGQAVSSGCIRMTNDDVIDLYGRARVGARVVVIR
jgi:lipoprotein-anchoring transpeptidase ErfK/SrfK